MVVNEAPSRPRAGRLFLGIVLTWFAPFVLFGAFMAVAELRSPFDAIRVVDPGVLAFVLVSGLVIAGFLTSRFRALSLLDGPGGDLQLIRRSLRRLLASLPALVLGYVVLGTFYVLLFFSGDAPWSVADVAVAVMLVLVVWSFILLPLAIVVLDEFGRRFGHLVGETPIAPIWMRTVQGLALSVMIAAAFVLGEYAQTGRVRMASWVLVATMVPYAVTVMQLNLRYTRNALQSFQRFLARTRQGERVDASELRSEALDEVGVLQFELADLVERLEATRARMEESETRMQRFAEAASDWFVEFDADLRVSWLSERFEVQTGIPPEQLLGRAVDDIGSKQGLVQHRMHEAMLAREPVRDYLSELRLVNGDRIVVQTSALPRFDGEGRFLGYLGACSNVTHIVEAQEALLDREAQLAQAQKMEAVGQLTGGIAHDFNNLLMAVAGNLELAQLEDPGLVDNELIESALGAANRGAKLVKRLLTFSRRQELRPEAVDLAPKLAEMEMLLRTTLGEKIALALTVPPTLPPPRVDAGQLESALLNLAINARDAMPDGGALTISARTQTLAAGESELKAGDYVVVAVADTGQGISPEGLPRVFEPFFSTKPVGAGSGLGLSMVYGFARQSGGVARITSVEGQGTTVSLWLPVADADRPAREAPPATLVEAVRADHQAILLIEDDDAVRALLSSALGKIGFAVTAARDATSARAAFAAGDFDLVLSDVVLPGDASGVDLVRAFRGARPELPCVLMTGYAREHLATADDWLRDIPVLAKPFQIHELVAVIRRALADDRTTGDRSAAPA
jgi:PAS domain S-box-containing protein